MSRAGYTHRVRITVNGIDFTSPGCDGPGEAEALKQMAERADGVENAEVERL